MSVCSTQGQDQDSDICSGSGAVGANSQLNKASQIVSTEGANGYGSQNDEQTGNETDREKVDDQAFDRS